MHDDPAQKRGTSAPHDSKAGDAGLDAADDRVGVEVVVARYAGYCYGVERALKIAEEAGVTLAPPIYTLGPIIHNPSVVRRLAERGIAAVDDIDQVREGTVIVRTHGVDPEVIAAAEARGLRVIDATCPFVNVAHQRAHMLREQGYVPVILGERDHPEVVGLLAWAGPRAIVVEDADELRPAEVRNKRVGVVVQTTQTRENLARLVAGLAPVARETLVFNTICDATEKRQAAARELAAGVDVVVVVGGRNSANTTRLASLCRAIQPRTHHIETAAELERAWLAGASRVGVTAGASTPDDEIEAAVGRIRDLAG
ncbi:MAG TPA: 4-hydroxy-3-methylbut-2-enyl diphosphate reductase [Thermoleophilia bacterium]|nr:4-hydroxy-3-methylbut-2-enyl diphosphate reductase [Thermoleophilia bacterium]